MGKILEGRPIAQRIKDELKLKVAELNEKGVNPALAVVLVGDNPASKVYVNSKKKACEEVGIISKEFLLQEGTTQSELMDLVEKLNRSDDVHGILVQLPLPKHLDEEQVLTAISPAKDVDGFHPVNVGNLMIGTSKLIPCTPSGVIEMIRETGIDICGKECVVIGRSNIVGKPLAMLLLQNNATVTVCHSKTQNLAEVTKRADILIAAVGKRHLVSMNMVKAGAVVIDVGMNRDDNGKLCGDVDYANVINKADYVTPVPGGVGPMTIAMLMKNTIIAAESLECACK